MSEKIGNRIIRLDEVDSTNSYLKGRNDLLQQHGLVVIADMQTSGRGRVGREFVSLRGKNLTFSVVLHPELPLGEIQVLSLLAGVAVSRVLEKYLNKIRLKWPNDVLVCEKKICGILLEAINIPELSFPVLVMGIGLNTKGCLNDYPEELQDIVTTIESEISRNFKIVSETETAPDLGNETVFQQLLVELECCMEEFSGGSENLRELNNSASGYSALLQEWLQRAQAIGRKVHSLRDAEEMAKDTGTVGTIEGLTKDGYLQIRTETGHIMTHVSGDILDMRGGK
ncbi:MAG: biotin--[acetyl-CoA-carboxylase] ligase [SAR324 cluster bacterium]|nr:biotin--[acetyl-CoA-carboxylase] ligase [SAR324 cluster bacterium]